MARGRLQEAGNGTAKKREDTMLGRFWGHR